MEKGVVIRVAVLVNSKEDILSEFKDIEQYVVTPANYFPEADSPYMFESFSIKKVTSYSDIRSLVHSKRFDVFFNLCFGVKDRESAGPDVVRALEEFNVPFTGADSKHYECTKTELKVTANNNNIKVPKYFVVQDVPSVEDLHRLTSILKYPLIVKHPNGFDSIGMTPTSKCLQFEDVIREVELFVKKYQCALVEEFIVGDEATVLAVATPTGTKVLVPLRVVFPPGEDFKHFGLKWKEYGSMKWVAVPDDYPARAEIERVGKVAFETMLGGVGYGRSDLRIDRTTNEVYFLEINPTPSILYRPGEEASADWILRLDPTLNHRDFIKACIDTAFLTHQKRQPLHNVKVDPHPAANRNEF